MVWLANTSSRVSPTPLRPPGKEGTPFVPGCQVYAWGALAACLQAVKDRDGEGFLPTYRSSFDDFIGKAVEADGDLSRVTF